MLPCMIIMLKWYINKANIDGNSNPIEKIWKIMQAIKCRRDADCFLTWWIQRIYRHLTFQELINFFLDTLKIFCVQFHLRMR